jgi:hypothetical protein
VKEDKIVQRYRFSPMKADANQMLTGLGTGQGTWGASKLATDQTDDRPIAGPETAGSSRFAG